MAYLLGAVPIIALISVLVWVLVLRSMASATPYVPISRKVFPFIEQELQLRDTSVFYDLGCGDGKVVAKIARAHPNVQCIGIEFSMVPYLLARFRVRNLPNARVIRKNFLTEGIGDATHIYLYLFPVLMPKLLKKFTAELTPGTKVLSCDFKFPEMVPVNQVKTGRPAGLGGTIYTYIF